MVLGSSPHFRDAQLGHGQPEIPGHAPVLGHGRRQAAAQVQGNLAFRHVVGGADRLQNRRVARGVHTADLIGQVLAQFQDHQPGQQPPVNLLSNPEEDLLQHVDPGHAGVHLHNQVAQVPGIPGKPVLQQGSQVLLDRHGKLQG